MTDATPLPFDLPSVERKKLTVDFAGGNQSSNGGLLLLRQAERKLGVCGRLAAAMPDRRDASRIRHYMFEMVMARAAAIACGYDLLRSGDTLVVRWVDALAGTTKTSARRSASSCAGALSSAL